MRGDDVLDMKLMTEINQENRGDEVSKRVEEMFCRREREGSQVFRKEKRNVLSALDKDMVIRTNIWSLNSI